MKRNYLVLIGLIMGCILFLQTGCKGQAGPPERSEAAPVMPKPTIAPEKAKTKPETKETTPTITFENVVYDFGEVGPKINKVGEFKFTNTGNGLLKITKVDRCCGVTTILNKKEYAPGESGTLKVQGRWGQQAGVVNRRIYVNSNDKTNPRVELAIKAKIVAKVDCEPKKINFMLKDNKTTCPEITLTSHDNQPFSIKQFKSTGDCITADVNSAEQATKFVLSPKVDTEKLQKTPNGFIEISLTHPELSKVTVVFSTMPEFKINPPSIIVFNAEVKKPVKREVWILNNYGKDFEIESTSSKNDTIKVLKQEKVSNGYYLEVEIIPPVAESKQKMFTDEFSVNIKDNKPLKVTCRGFYSRGRGSSSR